MASHKPSDSAPHVHGGHEKSDAQAGPLAKFAVAMVVFTVGAAFVVTSIFNHLSTQLAQSDPPSQPMQNLQASPPQPLLQAAPRADLLLMLEQEKAQLHSYAWISKPEGRVRIPVERAIELVAERGLPARASGGNP